MFIWMSDYDGFLVFFSFKISLDLFDLLRLDASDFALTRLDDLRSE
jgi:hypothetical protein